MSAMQDDAVGKAYDATLMRRLLTYLRPHWAWVVVAFVAMVGGSVADLAQPWLTQVAIDRGWATWRPASSPGPCRRRSAS